MRWRDWWRIRKAPAVTVTLTDSDGVMLDRATVDASHVEDGLVVYPMVTDVIAPHMHVHCDLVPPRSSVSIVLRSQ